MNEIKIYLKSSGSTAELYKDFNLYQGSYRNVQITIYAPSAMMCSNADNTYFNTVQTGAIMTAPNGAKVVTRSYNAAFVKTEVYNGVEYAVYTQIMPKEYALYAGAQLIVCNVVSIDNTDKAHPQIISVTTSQRAPLMVLESAYLDEDELLDPTEGEVIEGLINDLQQRLNKGEFAARAIYAWNSTYAYGAGELVFYPQKGEYGVFLKSLTDNNKAEPYVNGVIDSANWLLVSDFNILTELYTLKGDVLDAVQETRDNVAAAGQSANEAESSSQQAAQSATAAENAAQRIESQAQYLEGVKDGTIAVPKATSDGNGGNIAEHFETIESYIPSSTSAENQLADKAFVNSSINNMAAFYITSNAGGDAFATHAALIAATVFYSGGKVRVPTQNDYATVLADETQPKGVDGSYPTTRYTYQTDTQNGTYPNGQWDFQYVVNNTSLTQAQVDAINSGITAQKISDLDNATAAKYTKPSTGIPESDLASAVQEKLNKTGNVTGVKGNAETTYRTGNVNLTAENIGAPEAKNTIYGTNPKDLELNMEFDDEFLLAHGYMGSIHVNGNPDWYNLINVRHRNGEGDGNLYGLQIRKALTATGSPLQYRAQMGGDWTMWETIYSSSNPPYETGNNLGTNWIRFKNGVQICWGYFNNGSNTRDKVFQVSFGKAFSAPPCLVLTSGKTDGDSSYRSTYSNYYQITNTWANVGWYGENASSLCWIAIGTYA